MTILVPIKRVIDPYSKVRPLADGSGMDVAGVKFDVNPFDEIAVEEAVRKKTDDSLIKVIVVTIGGPECEDQLRKMLALGADEAILVETSDALDARVVAAELEALVKEIGVDLVLMGKQSTDDEGNQVGQMLAARLDWPQATFAAKLILASGQIMVVRETDDGEETLTLTLPALVTTDLRLNEPRYIALPGIVKARSKPLAKRARATTLTPKVRTVSYAPPPPRPAGQKVGSVDELVAALKGRGVL